MKYGVIVFPGASSARECRDVIERMGHSAQLIWHQDTDISDSDCLLLPGGHSYGDYLRPGAIAKLSPIMQSVEAFARNGGTVIGMGNGFQILLEAGLLPGGVLMNASGKYVCKPQQVKVESTDSPLTCTLTKGRTLTLPIEHRFGNFQVDHSTLEAMKNRGQIILTYEDNPNGSTMGIAGICNEARNVVGMMPHAQKAADDQLGLTDGRIMFESVASWARGGNRIG